MVSVVVNSLNGTKKNATHDVSVNTDKPGHYDVVKHKEKERNEKESTLLIKIFVNADANVTRWYVKTSKHGYEEYPCEFGQISLISSPQGIADNKGEILDTAHESLRRTEDQLLNLKCLIEPANTHRFNRIKWEFSKDDKKFSELPEGIRVHEDEIQIDTVKKFHRGYYRCTLNGVSFTVLLRVKDRLAALWPFIGIVSIVLILVIIILIFERRQKSNKKTVQTDDDEQDQASDPLVRATSKTTDNNDNKKRAVKA